MTIMTILLCASMTICDALKLIVMIVIGGVRSISRHNRAHARPSGATLQPRAIMNAIEKATQALAQLSDREWVQVKHDEERRRAQQQIIRDLAKRRRELRDREPTR